MERTCDACGGAYIAQSKASKFCKDVECKRARARGRKRKSRTGAEVVPIRQEEPTDDEVGVAAATRSELDAVGRLNTPTGQNAMALARKLDTAVFETGSAVAAVARAHLLALEKALEGAATAGDEVDKIKDELEAKRLERAAGGR